MEKEQGFNQQVNKPKETINIGFKGETETEQMLSNLAPTPFELNGKSYASVEGFWQSLKFSEKNDERNKIANLSGIEAKKAGRKAKEVREFEYQSQKFQVGSEEHQELMRKAIKAKLEQNYHVLNLLLKTGDKKITHILKTPDGQILPDSKTIPRAKFCDFLMELREEFRKR